jgi:hypothetical protein
VEARKWSKSGNDSGFSGIYGTRRLQLRVKWRKIVIIMIDISEGSLTAVLNKKEELFDAPLDAIRFPEGK